MLSDVVGTMQALLCTFPGLLSMCQLSDSSILKWVAGQSLSEHKHRLCFCIKHSLGILMVNHKMRLKHMFVTR